MTLPPSAAPSAVRRTRERVEALVEWWKDSRPGRATYRYLYARGALLCGGIAYSALFSLFAALTIGYTVFMQVLGGSQELMDAVFGEINELVPGLIAVDGEKGVIDPDDLLLPPGLSVTSIVAGVVLLFSVVSFLYHLRGAVRTMFGVSDIGQSPLLARARALLGFFLLALSMLVSAVASIAVSSIGYQLLEALGLSGGPAILVTGAGLVVSVLLDALVVVVVVTLLAGVHVRRRDLLVGSLTAAVAFGVLRYLGSSFVAGSASRNALLASFAVLVTLLILVNFTARILLAVCAWMANPPRPPDPEPDGPRHAREGRPELPVVDGTPTTDARHARVARHAASADVGVSVVAVSTEERLRAGQGSGRPWSPIVRGVRRARLPRGA
ncbi:YihY/virulence factor BrkB family protein [Cellulosimicrobium cellulans]|uniref:YihY/virulence factor BrkB family protein n=1 Tax=Cellulosimicrobium cellulans TaxID=1710 RepID=UPI002098252A|nr:YihY/virulence factor BrkB family protein [Cellulosimicrobium cellulans]MCO7272840.1 YihY/virulence factor BrkB family protein [Cellulosimicrobium cellulans]